MKKVFLWCLLPIGLCFLNRPCTAQPHALEWSFSFGNYGFEYGNSIALDPSGNVVVTGNYSGTIDFDPSGDSLKLTAIGPDDPFIALYTATGSLLWVNTLSCASLAKGLDVSTDPLGNVYWTGFFSQTADFNPLNGGLQLTATGQFDSFFAKYDPQGNLVWVRTLGGASTVFSRRIRADRNGNVIVAGEFRDTVDFDPDTSSFIIPSAGNNDTFLAKYDSSGHYLWVRRTGSVTTETATALDVDTAGNIYYGGHFFGTCDFDPGPAVDLLSSAGGSDVFFARYTAAGGYDWVKQIGSPSNEQCQDIDLDESGHVLITGLCSPNTDFDPGPGVAIRDSFGLLDVFVARYSPQGAFIFANTLGSVGYDEAWNVSSDAADNVYITGDVNDTTDFDCGTGTAIINGQGGNDAYVASYDPSGTYRWAFTLASAGNERGMSIESDAAGNLYVSGGFADTVDFDPDTTVYPMISNQYTDLYLARYSFCTTDTIVMQLIACDSALYNGQYYTSPGTYVMHYAPALGCDSIVELELTSPLLDTAITVVGVTLTSAASGVSYQWIDCANGNAPLPGDTLQSYTAAVNGSYAVVISAAGCSDTSACVAVTGVGLEPNATAPLLQLFPNPAKGIFTVVVPAKSGSLITLEVMDLEGRLLKSLYNATTNANPFRLSCTTKELSPGMYFLRATTPNGVSVKRFVLE